jgi:hypothetical protein
MDVVGVAQQIVDGALGPHESLLCALADLPDHTEIIAHGKDSHVWLTWIKVVDVDGVTQWGTPDREWDHNGVGFLDWVVAFALFPNVVVRQSDFEVEECDHHDECERFERYIRGNHD